MFYWTYTDRQIVKIDHYIKDMIEPRVNGLRWEHSMFASRLEVWGEASLPKTGSYIPLRRLIGFYPTELSALATFAGSTIISLVSYVSGISVRENQAGVSNFTVAFLVTLNLIIIGYSYRLIRKSFYDFKKYLRMEGWYYPDKGKPEDYQKQLKEHQHRFRCPGQDCRNFSHEPAEEPLLTHSEAAPKIVKIHWNIPKDFKRCSECGQWFCNLHYNDRLALCNDHADKYIYQNKPLA